MTVIDDIKQKVDIVDVISGYAKLQKSGHNYKAICPFHSEKTPSFFVFPEQQTWHCFGACGQGGDVYSFIMKKENVDFSQALRILADRVGVIIEKPEYKDKEEENRKQVIFNINEEAATYYHQLLLNHRSGQIARDYLKKRGVSEKIVEQFILGYSKQDFEDLCKYLSGKGYSTEDLLISGLAIKRDDGTVYDRFRNKLMFPICDVTGHYIGFGGRVLDDSLPKYINSPQTPVFDKSGCLYGINIAKTAIRAKNQVIVTEGYMDVLTSHQYGWENTVASMGTALTERQLNILKKLTKNLILALDSDAAGKEASDRAADSAAQWIEKEDLDLMKTEDYLGKEVRVVITAEGKDPDEVIRLDPEIWTKALDNARPFIDFLFDEARRKYDLSGIEGKSQAVEHFLPIISKIPAPIKKAEYVSRFARLLNINESYLVDFLNKTKADERKRKTFKSKASPTAIKPQMMMNSDQLEVSTLQILFRYPELRKHGLKLDPDYFESSENVELFLKWSQSEDFDDFRANLDTVFVSHLEKILEKRYPPIEDLTEDKMVLTFNDYVDRLQERHLRNILRKKAEVLSMESETGGQEAELGMLEEQGNTEVDKMKQIFTNRKYKRQIKV